LAAFSLLTRTFADDPGVRVIIDRRLRERRETSSAVPADRRRTDRRRRPPTSWSDFQYLVVSAPDAPPHGSIPPEDQI